MEKELYLSKEGARKAIIRNDDLIFDGKNIEVPSYYASVVLDYIAKAPVKTWNEADQEDFLQFKSFFEDVADFMERRVCEKK